MLYQRELWINQLPPPDSSYKVVRASIVEEISDLYQTHFYRREPLNLTMDCRGLRDQADLLKFFEEYKGALRVVMDEPVLPTVVSRFTRVMKKVDPPFGNLLLVRISRVHSDQLREKAKVLFGVSQDV